MKIGYARVSADNHTLGVQRVEPVKKVIVRQYGLLNPVDWGKDVSDELWRSNRFWNQLVEIERQNSEQYRQIMASSESLRTISQDIEALETERMMVIEERSRRRSSVRSKANADTGDLDERLDIIRDALRPLYAARKKLSMQARAELKPVLDELEIDRKAKVKLARQSSGLFWGNYNAVIDSFNVARSKTLKEGAQLRFRRFEGEGRLVNQIQGGMTVSTLMGGGHSQVQLSITGRTHDGALTGMLRVKAFVARDEKNKPVPRYVSFPIHLHRPIPADAVIKVVAVHISRVAEKMRYAVTFTCRGDDNLEPASGTGAAGCNLGWKSVKDGLRVATVVSSDGTVEHLVLPNKWINRMSRVATLQGILDDAVNEILPKIKLAISSLPAWREDVQVEKYPPNIHRRLSAVYKAKKLSARSMLRLFWDLKLLWEGEPNSVPLLHELVDDIEVWRKENKKILLEMANLRDKLLAQRKDLYRVFAKRLADRAGLVVIDDTSYRESAAIKKKSGEETTLYAAARANRVLAAPSSLKLAIEQSLAKRNGKIMKYNGRINLCRACGAIGHSGNIVVKCGHCGDVHDIDTNAASNLLTIAMAG